LRVAHSATEATLDAVFAKAHVAAGQIDAVDFVLAALSALHVSRLRVSAAMKTIPSLTYTFYDKQMDKFMPARLQALSSNTRSQFLWGKINKLLAVSRIACQTAHRTAL
jgi:hypothetical protein